MAGTVVALFVEVNSVTLHLRLLFKLAGAQSSPMYRINKGLNLFTYVFFRLSAQFYLTWYIIHNYSWLDHGFYLFCTMMMMNIMILIYFYRLLRADFFPRSKAHVVQNGPDNNNRKFLNDWMEKIWHWHCHNVFFLDTFLFVCYLVPLDWYCYSHANIASLCHAVHKNSHLLYSNL